MFETRVRMVQIKMPDAKKEPSVEPGVPEKTKKPDTVVDVGRIRQRRPAPVRTVKIVAQNK